MLVDADHTMLAVSEILELIALLPFLLRSILPALGAKLREGLATSRDGSGYAGVTSKGFLSGLLGHHLVVTSLSILGHQLSKVNSYLAAFRRLLRQHRRRWDGEETMSRDFAMLKSCQSIRPSELPGDCEICNLYRRSG